MTEKLRSALRRTIGRGGYFTLAFGAIVGSGWVVVLGEWLKAAGPGGSALGFLIGGCVMMIVSLCYGELAARFPTAGGEFLYTLQTFGPFPAFMVGWFLTLFAITVCGFEAIALSWMLKTLWPGMALSAAYSVGRTPVTWDALIIGACGALGIGFLHYRGASSAIRFQNIVTYGFIAVSVLLVCCGLSLGSIVNLEPLVSSGNGSSWIAGTLWIFTTSAFFLNGWQASLHAIEERRADLSAANAIHSMVAAIGVGAIFYASIIFASAMAVPWPSLITQELPAAAAFRALGGGGILGTVILVAAIASLTKTWSAMAWVATRLLFAQGRYGFLPGYMAKVDSRTQSPRNAVLLVTLVTTLELAFGRGAILPLVDMLSICAALSIILCLVVLLRQGRPRPGQLAFVVPGGTPTIVCGLIGATIMIGGALIQPFLAGRGKIPIEWIMLGIWGAIGTIVWFVTGRKAATRDWQSSSQTLD